TACRSRAPDAGVRPDYGQTTRTAWGSAPGSAPRTAAPGLMKLLHLPTRARWALACLLLAALAWLGGTIVRGRTVRFADGRAVTVLTVTSGTNHVFVSGKLWLQVLRPFLSEQRAAALGLQIQRVTTVTPSTIIWTRWQCPLTNAPARFASVRDRF